MLDIQRVNQQLDSSIFIHLYIVYATAIPIFFTDGIVALSNYYNYRILKMTELARSSSVWRSAMERVDFNEVNPVLMLWNEH